MAWSVLQLDLASVQREQKNQSSFKSILRCFQRVFCPSCLRVHQAVHCAFSNGAGSAGKRAERSRGNFGPLRRSSFRLSSLIRRESQRWRGLPVLKTTTQPLHSSEGEAPPSDYRQREAIETVGAATASAPSMRKRSCSGNTAKQASLQLPTTERVPPTRRTAASVHSSCSARATAWSRCGTPD